MFYLCTSTGAGLPGGGAIVAFPTALFSAVTFPTAFFSAATGGTGGVGVATGGTGAKFCTGVDAAAATVTGATVFGASFCAISFDPALTIDPNNSTPCIARLRSRSKNANASLPVRLPPYFIFKIFLFII